MAARLGADVERGFIAAYYQYVQGCKVSVDHPLFGPNHDPYVVVAHRPGMLYGMSFSTAYQCDTQSRPETLVRRVRRRVEGLRAYAGFLARQEGGPYQVLYEVWCFIPATDRVIRPVRKVALEGLPVQLVHLEEVQARLRETVLSLPEADAGAEEKNAFVWAGRLIREAFNLGSGAG